MSTEYRYEPWRGMQSTPTQQGSTGNSRAWLRKWALEVYLPQDNGSGGTILTEHLSLSSDDQNPSLRIRFDVEVPSTSAAAWYADIEIFNIDTTTTEKLLYKDMVVALSAGYKDAGQYGQIFRGPIFQATWERENVVDWKTTLRCVLGPALLPNNLVNTNIGPRATQQDVIAHLASNAMHPLQITVNQDDLDASVKMPRSQTFIGSVEKYLQHIAGDTNLQTWPDDIDSVQVGDVQGSSSAETALLYTPKEIIGTPQQCDNGIALRVLLDTRARVTVPPIKFKIDNSTIRFQKQQFGILPSILDRDGVYKIVGIRHYGDNRGDEWYTEMLGLIDAVDPYGLGLQGI